MNYSDFLAGTMDVASFKEERVRAVFNQFDTDHTGVITHLNLKNALQKFSIHLPW